MALSEHEQRLLAQIEAGLYAEDPALRHHFGAGSDSHPRVLRSGFGILLALAGLAVIIIGVAANVPALGVAGFALMLTGTVTAYQAYCGSVSQPGPLDVAPPSKARRAARDKPSFNDRMAARWQKRMDERDF